MYSLAEILHIVGVKQLESAADRLMRIFRVKGDAESTSLVGFYVSMSNEFTPTTLERAVSIIGLKSSTQLDNNKPPQQRRLRRSSDI